MKKSKFDACCDFFFWPSMRIIDSDWYQDNLGGTGPASLLLHFALFLLIPVFFWLLVLAVIISLAMLFFH